MAGRGKTRVPRRESMGKKNQQNIHKEWRKGQKGKKRE